MYPAGGSGVGSGAAMMSPATAAGVGNASGSVGGGSGGMAGNGPQNQTFTVRPSSGSGGGALSNAG